jgi:hypothetical protein
MTTNDETAVIPPDLAPTQARAYSDAEDYDDAEQGDTQLGQQRGDMRGHRAAPGYFFCRPPRDQ